MVRELDFTLNFLWLLLAITGNNKYYYYLLKMGSGIWICFVPFHEVWK